MLTIRQRLAMKDRGVPQATIDAEEKRLAALVTSEAAAAIRADDDGDDDRECPACGEEADEAAKFCDACGKELPLEEDEDEEAARHARLLRNPFAESPAGEAERATQAVLARVRERARRFPPTLLGVRLQWPDGAPPRALSIDQIAASLQPAGRAR